MSALTGYICSHVASGAPVLCVGRTEPLEADDTGVSLHCGAGHEIDQFLVVRVARYLDHDLLLREIVDGLEVGYQASRTAPARPWLVEPLPAEDEAA